MTIIAKKLSEALGFDTSENLNAQQYGLLKSQGYTWGCRYVPLSGQSSTAQGVIQPSELATALSLGLGLMFVQFARNSGWSATTGLADGKTAGAYVLGLGVPSTVCLWLDLGITPNSQIAIDYANAWFEGTVEAGMQASAAGVYCEPGVPLTAQQRYLNLNVSRYWATAANDPNKIPTNRGCQVLQLWGSSKGEIFPEPGLVIDADVSQMDYFGSQPVAAYAA